LSALLSPGVRHFEREKMTKGGSRKGKRNRNYPICLCKPTCGKRVAPSTARRHLQIGEPFP
jgi:hypothetical protein